MGVPGVNAGSQPINQNPAEKAAPPAGGNPPENKAPAAADPKPAPPQDNSGQKLSEFTAQGFQNRAKLEAKLVTSLDGAAPGAQSPVGKALGQLDAATEKLNKEDGAGAAKILQDAAAQARADAKAAKSPAEATVLNSLAHNFDARAKAYTETTPQGSMKAAQDLYETGWKATTVANELEKQGHKKEAALLRGIGEDSKLQANLTNQAAINTNVLLGKTVSSTYQQLVNASFDVKIAGTRDWSYPWEKQSPAQDLRDQKAKMGVVFKELNRTMEETGVSFDRAWGDMFDDARIDGWKGPQKVPGFPTRKEAAMYLRDNKVTSGLLSPMSDLSRALSTGDQKLAERAQADMVKTLKSNDQWEIAKQVLNGLKDNAQTPEGKAEAQKLADSHGWDKFKAKASQFILDEGPTFLLTAVVSGGVGNVVKGLATAAKMSSTAVKVAGVTAEIGAFVPTERILNEALNNKKADWSAGSLARDYAFTVGGYALFKAMGKGWEAIKARGDAKPFQAPKVEPPAAPKVEAPQVKPTTAPPVLEGGQLPTFKNYDDLVNKGWFGKQVKVGDPLPDGYTWNSGRIQRNPGKVGENYAPLALDDAGRIMLKESTGRLSIPSVMKGNFKDQLAKDIKAANPGFTDKQVAAAVAKEMERVQIHHILPDEIIKNSELGKAAREAGYNVDRASNLTGLPNSAANMKPGEQVAHWSSHPKYSKMVQDELNNVAAQLKQKYGSLDKVPKQELIDAMKKAEEKFLQLLKDGKVPKTPEGRLAFAPPVDRQIYA